MKNKSTYSLLMFILFLTTIVSAATTMNVNPVQKTLSLNDTFVLTVDVDTTDSIVGTQFNVLYDPDVIQAVSETEGGFFSRTGDTVHDTSEINNSEGFVLVSIYKDDTYSGLNGSGHLVNLTFKAITREDTTQIKIENAQVYDSSEPAPLTVYPSSVENGTVYVYTSPNLIINEFMPYSSGHDWVEIYNNDTIAIDLAGWSINDSIDNTKAIESGIIEPGSHFYVDVVNMLNKDDDTIQLINVLGEIISQYSYMWVAQEDVSIGRLHDALPTWIEFDIPTPNATNNRLSQDDIPNQTIEEDTAALFNLSHYIADPDGDLLEYSVVDSDEVACSIINDTNISLNPAQDYYGEANCTIRIDDSYGTIDKTFFISVLPVNDAPEISFSSLNGLTIFEDSFTLINLSEHVVDVDTAVDDINWSCSADVADVAADVDNVDKMLNITSSNDFYGELNITCTADDNVDFSTENFTMVVLSDNDAPIISGISDQNAVEETNLTLNVTPYLYDVDTNISELTITTDSPYGDVDGQVITFNYPNGILQENVTITASDGLLSGSQNITINITNVNDDPVLASIGDKTATESLTLSFDLEATDEDPTNDNLTFQTNASICGFQLNQTSGEVTLTPCYADVGVHDVLFRVTDGKGGQDNETVTLTILSSLEISDLDIAVDGTENSNLDDLDTVEAMPGSLMEVDVELKNLIDMEIRGITVNGSINTDLGLLQESSLIPKLEPDQTETVTLQFSLPNIIGEEVYPLHIKGIGEDEDHILRIVERTIYIDVKKDNNDVIVEDVNLTPDEVGCVKEAVLSFNITNRGSKDQINGNTIRVSSEQLGIDIEEQFAIDKNTSIRKTYNINTTKDDPGSYAVSIEVTWFYTETIQENVYLEVSECFGIPDFSVDEDTEPASNWIDLWNYTDDPNYPGSHFTYSVESQSNSSLISCSINANRYVDCGKPSANATGHSDVNISATGSYTEYSLFRITVEPVNDPPFIAEAIPDVEFDEDGTNSSLDLDDYAEDIDSDNLIWTWSGNKNITVSIAPNKVITFGTLEDDWYGSETITLNVSDGEFVDSQDILVTVNQLFDDLPYIKDALPTQAYLLVGDGLNLDFHVDVADPDGIAHSINWYIEDVLEDTGADFQFNKATAGTFDVVANVSNATDTFDRKEWTVQVSLIPITTYGGTINDVNESNVNAFTGLTIENEFGKIDFGNQTIDLSNVVDVDRYVELSLGKLGIDSDAFTVFQSTPSDNSMYQLPFVEQPEILYNSGFAADTGIACPGSICSGKDYANGTLTFEIPHFSMFFVNISNPPAADAGSDRTVDVDSEVILDGSGSSDPDGDIVAYIWAQISGPQTVNLSTTGVDFQAKFTPTVLGDYEFGLVVVDSAGLIGEDTVAIKVVEGEDDGAVGYLRITDLDVKVNGNKDSNLNNGETISDEAKPGETVELDIEIKNIGDEDIEDIDVEVTIVDIDDGDDLEEDDTIDEIKDGKDERIEIEFQVPEKVEEDVYEIRIHIEGDDGSEIDWTLELEVEKDKHMLKIFEADLSPSVISCNRVVGLDVGIRNIGSEEEEDVELTVKSSQLGLDERNTFDLSEDIDDDDNEYEKRYTFVIDDDLEQGSYPVTIEVEYDDGDEVETEILYLTVQKCAAVPEEDEEEEEDIVDVQILPGDSDIYPTPTTVPKQPTTITFRDSGDYMTLLVIVMIILLGAVIYAIGAAVMILKRR